MQVSAAPSVRILRMLMSASTVQGGQDNTGTTAGRTAGVPLPPPARSGDSMPGRVPAPAGLEEEPGTTFGLVDPHLDEACTRDIAVLVAHVMDLAQACGEFLVVVTQLGQHVQRLDVVGIVVRHALHARDVPDGAQGVTADL